MTASLPQENVAWHDVECGRYTADLPLWRELAAACGPGVLDVGAGTGRVALDLAQRGHAVTAFDLDAELLAACADRADAAGVRIETLVGDAATLDAGEARFGLVVVPMQTIQLLCGPSARAGLLRGARRALAPGGRLAIAITAPLEPFDAADGRGLPAPDVGDRDGWRLISQPLAVRVDEEGMAIERLRIACGPDGAEHRVRDRVRLHHLSPAGLAEEAEANGLYAETLRHVPETDEHVGSDVVVLACG